MDKIKLISLGVMPEAETKQTPYGDVVVTFKKRIPYEQVFDMIQWCIDFIINDRPFVSAPLKRIIKDFAILKWYTDLDISFVETSLEMKDIYESYDIAESYGVIEEAKNFIEQDQFYFFVHTLDETLESILAYRNSARGLIDILAASAETEGAAMQGVLDFIDDQEKTGKINNLIEIAEKLK